MKNATAEKLMNELDNANVLDINQNCLEELKNIKIKKNLGQIV